jgi:hypothetical protein
MASDENPYFDAHVASSSSDEDAAPATTSTSEPSVTIDNPATPSREQPPTSLPAPPPASLARNVRFQPLGGRQQSSIRLRKYSAATPSIRLEPISSEGEPDSDPYSQQAVENSNSGGNGSGNGLLSVDSAAMGRQRSNSGSRSLRLAQALSFNRMPAIQDSNQPSNSDRIDHALKPQNRNTAGGANGPSVVNRQEYASNIVDFLDVIGQ